MAAIELMCTMLDIAVNELSKEEVLVFEAELFSRIYKELKEIFRQEYKNYFNLMKFKADEEEAMLDSWFVRLVLKDILASHDYDIKGVAHYTNTHEDVLSEVIEGINTNPSALLLQRCIDIHRSVRRDLYQAIVKKIASDYLIESNLAS